jgi:predicted nuclease of predicted toxin-antitoxin system
MKFLVDAQLPPVLATRLVLQGHAAFHVQDVGLRDAGDADVVRWAVAEGCVLITKDRDFASRPTETAQALQVLWVRIGNVPNPVLLERFNSSWNTIEALFAGGALIVELR